tara:strand:- start:60 stop:266 length:207 start_codon:yes stop_codon:yes gene_type:complete
MAKLKKLRPGIYGTPGAFSKELLDSLKLDYKAPPGGTFDVNKMKQVKGKTKKEVEKLLAKKRKQSKKA